MTKTTCKQPLRNHRGPDGQRFTPPPEPEPPPRDTSSKDRLAGSAHRTRAPITTGHPTIRVPSHRPRPQAASATEPPITRRCYQVTMVTDEATGPPGPPPSSRHRMKYGTISPELGQPDVLGISAVQLAAQKALQKRVLREHAKRAEGIAHAAYERSYAALKLISESMENTRSAFAEAKRARDRYYTSLAASSQSYENACHRAKASNPSADQQRCVRSGEFTSEERQDPHPSPGGSMDLGTRVSTPQRALSAQHIQDTRRMRVHEWVENQRSLLPRHPSIEVLTRMKPSAPPPSTRAKPAPALLHNPAKPTTGPRTGPPAGPQRLYGKQVSSIDQYDDPLTGNPFGCKVLPHIRHSRTPATVPWDPGGHPRGSISS